MDEAMSPRQREALQALEGVISNYADVFGPVDDSDAEPDNARSYTAEELGQMTPIKNAVLSQWILLTAWTDMEDGTPYTSAYTSPGMPTFHRVGLLMSWMDAWR